MTLSSKGLEGQSLTSGYNDTMILNEVNIRLQEGKV
ncbi:ABC transporter ATP-binding protein, partial [Vibrio sp. 2-2(9)]|nr:ABC transporter ATP-binding protein [Vibrio sp. 2-2(9)]